MFALYAFVRTADNFVDQPPGLQDGRGFDRFRDDYVRAVASGSHSNHIINSFVELSMRKQFHSEWVDSFLDAMAQDLTQSQYATIDDTLRYMYGSAEVIGLMMASIMELPQRAHGPARLLGRAMQYINFIRDISEDLQLGRTYLPLKEIESAGLNSLQPEDVRRNPSAFRQFVRDEIERYIGWQKAAEAGFCFIPRRPRVAICTASAMYRWTARRIFRDPIIVFHKKVKPSIGRIFSTIAISSLRG